MKNVALVLGALAAVLMLSSCSTTSAPAQPEVSSTQTSSVATTHHDYKDES